MKELRHRTILTRASREYRRSEIWVQKGPFLAQMAFEYAVELSSHSIGSPSAASILAVLAISRRWHNFFHSIATAPK